MSLFKSTIYTILFASLFYSCSKDDGPTTTDESAIVVGTYTISEVLVNSAQDVNNDGTSSTNLLNEMTCITGILAVNSDKSWSLNLTNINVTTITGGTFFIECGNVDESAGAWTFSNNTLSLNGSFEPVIYRLDVDTLTQQVGEDLPSFRSYSFTKN